MWHVARYKVIDVYRKSSRLERVPLEAERGARVGGALAAFGEERLLLTRCAVVLRALRE
ncbi:hypothetical protein [Ktedonospora formicarum]|uniref:Uncharacterized protein n=1 Tax=Ktedonospora formicarum TaxID=2778364 RepID=A0A8J3IDG0_9CHLR|nr:hypothetical protein [Ktedonospora formicarum]GHO50722.1 hypothetical protein KSX_88850 [Ktedonospora formicarum]